MEVSDEIKWKVWTKAKTEGEYDPAVVRKDSCGAWIIFDHYGNTDSDFGWVIDHIYPQSKLEAQGVGQESIDDIVNLRPLQWENNVSKGDDYPNYKSVVKAADTYNEHIESERVVNRATQEKLKSFFNL